MKKKKKKKKEKRRERRKKEMTDEPPGFWSLDPPVLDHVVKQPNFIWIERKTRSPSTCPVAFELLEKLWS
jgi:hypothetical protein